MPSQVQNTGTPPVTLDRTSRDSSRRTGLRRLLLAAGEVESRSRPVLRKPRTTGPNASTESLKPLSDALYNEMLARIKQTDLSVPVRRGGYSLLHTRTHRGGQAVSDSVPARRRHFCAGSGGARGGPARSQRACQSASLTPAWGIRSQRRSESSGLDDRLHRGLSPILSAGKRSAQRAYGVFLPGIPRIRVTSVAWAADNKTLFS